jgi:hypothetical protein
MKKKRKQIHKIKDRSFELKIRKTLNNRTENMPRRKKKPAALGLTVEGACSVLNPQAKQGSDDDDERKRFIFIFLV